jgi:predicted NBD/HSP70 family sugar kinase
VKQVEAVQQPITARVALQLRDAAPATVNELSRSLELSRTSVENAIGALIETGLIAETPVVTSGAAGRPARQYAFRTDAGVVVGVDIGAASIRVIVADRGGDVVAQETYDGVSSHVDGAAKLAAVADGIRATLATAAIPLSRVRAIGVSLPGIVDDAGFVTTSVVIPEWSGIDIGAQLRHTFGRPVSVDNGVRLAAVAEHHLGVAQLVEDVIYLSVGNRIAMGLILGGRPRRGVHNAAGDIGRLAFRGPRTGTGQILWRTAPTAAEVFALALTGDPQAQAELDAFIDELAHGIAMLTMIVDPAMIVIGGGLSEAHEQLLDPLRKALPRYIDLPFQVPVAWARLGAEAAAHGAVIHAFQRHSVEIYGVEGMRVPSIIPLPHDKPVRAAEVTARH